MPSTSYVAIRCDECNALLHMSPMPQSAKVRCDACNQKLNAEARKYAKSTDRYPTAVDINMDAHALHSFGVSQSSYMSGYVESIEGCNVAYWHEPYEIAELACQEVRLSWLDATMVTYEMVDLLEQIVAQVRITQEERPKYYAAVGPVLTIHAYAIAKGMMERICEEMVWHEGGEKMDPQDAYSLEA